MRGIWMAILLLLALPLAAENRLSGDDIEYVLVRRVDVWITVDPQGNLVKYDIRTPLEAEGASGQGLKARLGPRIEELHFEPVLVGGKAVTAETMMRLTLVGKAQDDGSYIIVIDNITFPMSADAKSTAVVPDQPQAVGIAKKRMTPPTYPEGYAVESLVLLHLRLAPDGSVAEVSVPQSSLLNVRGQPQQFAKALRDFEQVATRAAKRWRFTVDRDDGDVTANGLTLAVPVHFSIDRKGTVDRTDVWQWMARSAWKRAPWLQPAEAQAIGVADLADGEMTSLESPFRLSGALREGAI